jgi:hypothetical protein
MSASRIQTWFRLRVLLAFLLGWLTTGVYGAITGQWPDGKPVRVEEHLNELLVFGACLGAAVVICCLPKTVRDSLIGAIAGAWVGWVAAMLYTRIRYGFGDMDWPAFQAGVREGGIITIPLMALAGLAVALAFRRHTP